MAWALTATYAANWHPLTWVSHLLDVHFYGMSPAGHHATSAFLHTFNVVLLFVVFRKMTGSTWRSGCIASLFAVHPLHVESVAWVSERKDVLSVCFGLLALGAYLRYVAAPGFGRYLTVAAIFALGLLAKPMLVTLPFALLLLDFWPLGRLGPVGSAAPGQVSARAFARLAAEKIPLLCISAVSGAVTYLVQVKSGALISEESLPQSIRAANAVISYVRYLGKTLWPTNLAAFYPFPVSGYPSWKVWAAGALLVLMSIVCVARWRRAPYLVVGWLWFLGTLVPVIGFVQAGRQALADRYTYLPHVGLFLLLVWGCAEFARTSRSKKTLAVGFGGAVSALAVLSSLQVEVWRDNLTLYRHAVAVTQDNSYMHYNLGVVLGEAGRTAEEIAEYREALRILPTEPDAHYNLALAFDKLGLWDLAIENYHLALQVQPNDVAAHNNLGLLLYNKGRTSEAIAYFRQALKLRPDLAEVRRNLHRALARERATAGQSP